LLVFKNVRWQNFLSTGNVFTEIALNEETNTLIIGKNGSGKSTILDALTFGLFGKPFRNINKPNLVNSINGKAALVEIEFKLNNKNYKIIRGIKPTIFEIYIDGTLLDQSSKSTDYQDHLEKYILKMNYKAFTQIVILGSASFVPFMQLSAADRRGIIEELLDIQIFSVMNIVTKNKIQVNKENMEKNRLQTSMVEEKVKLLERTIESLSANREQLKNNIRLKISKHQSEIDDLYIAIDGMAQIADAIYQAKSDLAKLREQKQTHLEFQMKIKNNLKRATDEATFFRDGHHCPKCKQELHEELKAKTVAENEAKIVDFESALAKLVRTLAKFSNEILESETQLSELEREYQYAVDYKKQIDHYQKLIADLEADLESPDNFNNSILEENNQLKKECDDELAALVVAKTTLLDERQHLELVLSLLKDGGIKTKIIKQYLPIINKCINKYLQAMDFYINFTIDESFSESIKSRYRDEFAYENFSEGEKQKIDLALLFTWRTIARMKNSINTNLLILDEIFDSSLDGDGTDAFMKILQDLTKDTNCFIISHKRDQMLDKFEKVIRFEKIKDFSRIVE
jgi:DNA repair exonuclease SbcCD ATPase subunit